MFFRVSLWFGLFSSSQATALGCLAPENAYYPSWVDSWRFAIQECESSWPHYAATFSEGSWAVLLYQSSAHHHTSARSVSSLSPLSSLCANGAKVDCCRARSVCVSEAECVFTCSLLRWWSDLLTKWGGDCCVQHPSVDQHSGSVPWLCALNVLWSQNVCESWNALVTTF
jgi:hypothetical protein